jgi:hypothetical protein
LEHLTSAEWEQLEDFVAELEHRISLHRHGAATTTLPTIPDDDDDNERDYRRSSTTSSLSDAPPVDVRYLPSPRSRTFSFSGLQSSVHRPPLGSWKKDLPVPRKCEYVLCQCLRTNSTN